jgi:anti-anti-sigma factor
MEVKIDTKEKFHVITLLEPQLSASMTEEIANILIPLLETPEKNVILNLRELQLLDTISAERLVNVQQKFYEQNASFVVCELQPAIESFLDDQELLEMMNVTPTESEAWDVVQMEEIERELLDGN